ncbi:Tumor necrosis factor alpha-induced protein 2 [Tupaia chinensis]|uniref:Tumor necrosis factor alpha-induced protein 2 n=1 Tax=Tupaia chinensis TaxID=246437 RepID=L9JA74_TUPCH|nr:Tumor necrosis factor alpha-induced protein 2 [Tupaia chinensis]
MLKMMTFFQGLPGQQTMPAAHGCPRTPRKLPSMAEVEAEASMSETSSEDLVPPPQAREAPDREKDKAAKRKEKKSRGLAGMFNVFSKGKKKGQPRSAEPEPEARPRTDGPLPTVEELKDALERGRLEAAGPLLALERELQAGAGGGGAGGGEPDNALGRDGGTRAPPIDSAHSPGARRANRASNTHAHTAPSPGRRPEARRDPPPTREGEARATPRSPAEFDVVATYAQRYHQHFAAHLAALAQFELCERDTYMLLVWVQNLYPNDILNSPKLAGELQAARLGSLLPPNQTRLLEATFLSNEVANVKELMARALAMESQRWVLDEAPHRLDGHCHSELAIDIMQIISQGQDKAEYITPDLGLQTKQVLLVELAALLRSYQRTFDEFLERGRHLRNFRANIMASINSCLAFRTSMEQKWQLPQAPPSHLLDPLNELKNHGFDTLLQSLFVDLKPLFKKFTQTRWAAPEETLEEIMATVGGRLPEFSELQDCFRQELMAAVHLHLVKEYIIRLSKRRLVLKTAEQQQQLAKHILANAKAIQDFCTQNGSSATWLQPALPTLAEVIRLQDPSAIKVEVATYATCYPDFSKGHLSAILTIKGNLSNSDVKGIRSILDVSSGLQEPSRALFSLIKVG